MPGAPTIIAQGVPAQIVSFPGWLLPTRVRVVADMVAGAPVLRAADSTPGLTITNGAGAGIFDMTFPPGKKMGDVNPQVFTAGPNAAATRFFGVPDVSTTNTNATTGKLRIDTASTAGAANPTDGSVLEFCWYVDYG